MQKLLTLSKRAYAAIKKRHLESKIANILDISKDEWQDDFDKNFNDAKKISDFIGFIVRWIFLQFTWSYCMARSPKEENIIFSYSLGMLGFAALCLQVIFSVKIFAMIMAHYCKDIQIYKSRWAKITIAIASLAQVLILYIGVYYFIREVSRNTSLLK